MSALSMEHIETKCPVCHENYVEPKILPCAHLLCRNCLISWVKTSTEAHCPLCRSSIYYPKDNNLRSSEDMADSLPTDHAMSAIVESCNILSKRQVCFLHINTDAVSLCLACSVMMCQSCVEYHHALPMTSSHKIENLATLTSERLAAFQQTPCSAHPNETAKLVCSTHSIPICHLCASSKHRACQEVTDLNEILEKHKQSFAEMADDLTKAESDLNEVLVQFEEMVVTTEKDTAAAYTKIDSMCDDFIISVETCRNKLKKILKESEEILQAAIEERKSYIARRIGLVTSHRLLLKRVQQTASASVQFAMVNVIQTRVKDLSSVVSLPSEMKPMKIAKLNIDEEIPLRVKRELGNISQMTVISPIRDQIHSGVQNIWMFHNNCGKNIVLDRNRQTAEVKNSSVLEDRLVMSSEPMSTNILYELQKKRSQWLENKLVCLLKNPARLVLVEEVDTRYNGNFTVIGFCQEDPLSIILPSDYSNMKNFVGVYSVSCTRHGQWNNVQPCPALKTVKAGSRIGVIVDTSHSLRVYVDGQDQGVVAKNGVQQCYAVFDLRYFLKKVCAFSFRVLMLENDMLAWFMSDYASHNTYSVIYNTLLLIVKKEKYDQLDMILIITTIHFC